MRRHSDGLTTFLSGMILIPLVFALFVIIALIWKPLAIVLLSAIVISLVISLINDYRRHDW